MGLIGPIGCVNFYIHFFSSRIVFSMESCLKMQILVCKCSTVSLYVSI